MSTIEERLAKLERMAHAHAADPELEAWRAARSAASENTNTEQRDSATMREGSDARQRVGSSESDASVVPQSQRGREAPTFATPVAHDVPQPGGMPLSQPGTPTARGSMPTRDDFELAFNLSSSLRTDRYADIAYGLIAPHVEALERDLSSARQDLIREGMERDEARRSQRKAEERADVFLDEHRDAVKERDAALARAEKAERVLVSARWLLEDKQAPPPSASAGTGTISDDHLAQDLLDVLGMRWSELSETLGLGQWTSRGKAREMARRAKELLGGSKAVKLPTEGELAVKIIREFDDEATVLCRADEIAKLCLELVRAALAGRGET